MGARITRVLADDQAVLASVAARAERAQDPTEQQFLLGELLQMVGSHLLAIEQLILPALESRGAVEQVPDLLTEVEAAQATLAEVLTATRDEPPSLDHLGRLCVRLRVLQDHEGQRLADALTAYFDNAELTVLGAECQDFLSRRRMQLPNP